MDLLRTLPLRTVTTLHILLGSAELGMTSLEELDWTSLDSVLSGSLFSSLDSLCIEVFPGLHEALRRFLAEHLPNLWKQKPGVYIDQMPPWYWD